MKKAIQQASLTCKQYGSESSHCIAAELSFSAFTPLKLGLEYYKAYYYTTVTDFKRECDITPDPGQPSLSSATQMYKCVQSTANFFPGLWALDKADNMLNAMMAKIPGMKTPCNMDLFGYRTMLAGTSQVLLAFYSFGNEVAKSYSIAGDKASAAYNATLKHYGHNEFVAAGVEGFVFVEFASTALVNDCAKLALGIAKAAVNCAIAWAKDVVNSVVMVGLGVLNLSNAALNWLCVKMGACKSAKHCGLSDMVRIFGSSVVSFFGGLASLSPYWKDVYTAIGAALAAAGKFFKCLFCTC